MSHKFSYNYGDPHRNMNERPQKRSNGETKLMFNSFLIQFLSHRNLLLLKPELPLFDGVFFGGGGLNLTVLFHVDHRLN